MITKLIMSLLIGFLFSAVTIYLAFKGVPLEEIITYLGKVNYWWVIPGIAIGISSFILRAIRWKLLINTTRSLSFTQIFHPLMIGFMLNCVFPMRIGEIARPTILYKKENIPFSTGISSIVIERVFDSVSLLILFIIFISAIEISPDLVVSFGKYNINSQDLHSGFNKVGILFLICIAGITVLCIKTTRSVINTFIIRLPSLIFFISKSRKENLKEKISGPLVSMIENFASCFELLKNPKKTFVCMVLTFSIWLIQAFAYQVITFGFPGISLTFVEITTMMIIICFFIALPSVPGFWGLWEAGGIFALSLFSVARENAAGYTLINHAIQIVPVIIVGVVSAFIIGINIKQLYVEEQS